jgi:uncharacterized protein (TIGR02284 family)
MNNTNNDTLRILNDLIETCEDGAHGYHTAAEDAKDAELRALFQRYADQRGRFARELRDLSRQHGGSGEAHESVAGKLHRGWIDLKSALSTNEPHAVLAECERGEDAAVKSYREALEKLQDVRVRDIVQRQAAEVQSAHDTVRDLRDSPAFSKRR